MAKTGGGDKWPVQERRKGIGKKDVEEWDGNVEINVIFKLHFTSTARDIPTSMRLLAGLNRFRFFVVCFALFISSLVSVKAITERRIACWVAIHNIPPSRCFGGAKVRTTQVLVFYLIDSGCLRPSLPHTCFFCSLSWGEEAISELLTKRTLIGICYYHCRVVVDLVELMMGKCEVANEMKVGSSSYLLLLNATETKHFGIGS